MTKTNWCMFVNGIIQAGQQVFTKQRQICRALDIPFSGGSHLFAESERTFVTVAAREMRELFAPEDWERSFTYQFILASWFGEIPLDVEGVSIANVYDLYDRLTELYPPRPDSHVLRAICEVEQRRHTI